MSLPSWLLRLSLGALAESAVGLVTAAASGHQNVFGHLERNDAGDRLRPWRAGERLPVIFCHGYMGDRSNFVVLQRRLYTAGFRSQATVWLFPYWRGCRSYADQIERKIDEVLDATGAPAVDIVAHSMGGVASRLALATPGRAGDVRRLVTLGSPHNGTPTAYAAVLTPFDASARDVRPGSDLLRELSGTRDLAVLPAGKVLSIRSDWDQVVPSVSSIVPAPQENLLIPGMGHGTLLYSRRVARAVEDALPAPAARIEVLEAPPTTGARVAA